MKWNAVKFCVVSLLLVGLSGCGGGSSGSSTGSSTVTTPATITAVSGVAQGPIVSGTVSVQEVLASLASASAPTNMTTSALGAFSTPLPASPYVELTATGNYFDEVLGKTSSSPLTLYSFASRSDNPLNVNILTSLAYQRIQTLMTGVAPLSFSAARTQAEQEVLAAFYIRDQNTIPFGSLDLSKPSTSLGSDENHILAAITSVFENGGTSYSNGTSTGLNGFIKSVQNEFADNNGSLSSSYNTAALKSAPMGINPVSVSSNLNKEFSSSLFQLDGTDISYWLDQDGDHVIGKFKDKEAIQVTANQPYKFSYFYIVGASDNGATYSFPPNYSGTNPYALNQNFNSSCTFTTIGVTTPVAAATVNTGDPINVTCTPSPHEASSTYLQSVPSGSSTPIYIARYDFNPFATVASQTYAPTVPTATVLKNGIVLVAGGSVAGKSVNTAELYNPATKTWITAGAMLNARSGHTATLLNDGTVLVVGGDAAGKAGTAELYTPGIGFTAGTWTKASSPASGHINHTATKLQNGQVLVVGGNLFPSASTASVEFYDPTAKTWTTPSTPGMLLAGTRTNHTATLLQDCSVLIAGGIAGNGVTADAEVFNYSTSIPSTCATVNPTALAGIWTSVGSGGVGTGLTTARSSHTATLLLDGTVLIAGGLGAAGTLNQSESFDPGDVGLNISSIWSPTAPLITARSGHIAQLLSDGTVLVAGGSGTSSTLASAELYNTLTTGLWTLNGGLAYARSAFAAVPITVQINNNPNNTVSQVLLVGGGVAPAETFQ